MYFTATMIVLALAATVVSGQNYVNGTRTFINGGWQTYYNGSAENCGNACDVDCSVYVNHGPMTLNMFSGGSDHSSYTYRMHYIGNLNADQMMINQLNSLAPLYVEVDGSFAVTNLYIGVTGYMRTTGGFNQNSIVLSLVNFYMSASSTINDAAFRIPVTNYVGINDGAIINVATMLIYNSGQIGNVNITTTVGLLISAAVTAANTNFDIGGDLVIQNPAGSDPTQTTALTCTGSTQVTADNMYTRAPTSTLGCTVTVADTLYSTPAADTSSKRDGGTQATVFNGGSSTANYVAQTGTVLNSLIGSREVKAKRTGVYPNQLVLKGGHQMTILSGLTQAGQNPTITIAQCNCQVYFKFTNTQTVSQVCTGCQAPGCSSGVFKTRVVKPTPHLKREDEAD